MNAIETRKLTKSYGKERGIIDLDLVVPQGEIFGFIGPNGAGKSTTIKTLLNFIHPTSGTAFINGLDVVKDTVQIKRDVGYIPSEVSYYDDMTAQELLDYSAGFYRRDCTKRRNHLCDVLGVELGRKIEDLSLGNRKKVAIVQALQHAPQVIILDEPTSGLDPLVQARFFELIREENQRGATVFFSSHILSEVQRLCHRVGIIRNGRLIQVDAVEKLRASQYKKVKVQASLPEGLGSLNLPGVQEQKSYGRLTEFLFGGDINDLLKAIAAIGVEDVWLEDPSLEEIFMNYYEGGE